MQCNNSLCILFPSTSQCSVSIFSITFHYTVSISRPTYLFNSHLSLFLVSALSPKWREFDDAKVTKIDESYALSATKTVRTDLSLCLYVCVWLSVCLSLCVCVCGCLSVSMCVCVWLSVCLFFPEISKE